MCKHYLLHYLSGPVSFWVGMATSGIAQNSWFCTQGSTPVVLGWYGGAWNLACPQKRQASSWLCCHCSPKLLLLLQSTLLCFSVNGVFKEGKSPQSLISQLTPASSDLALSPFPCGLAVPPLPSLLPSFLSGDLAKGQARSRIVWLAAVCRCIPILLLCI